MQIQFHGHACFSVITSDNTHILIDPFLDGNPVAKIASTEIHPQYILITHGHSDHLGDAISISKRTGATIVANVEIIDYCRQRGAEHLHGMNIGGSFSFPFGTVKMVSALHSSSITEGNQIIYLGNPSGFLLKTDGKTIYHAGDTGLSHEMTLIGNANKIDLAMLPIGGNFTMDTADAMLASRALRARMVIPMHYNTFPIIETNVNFFANQLLNFGIPCAVLAPEETLNL